MRTSTAPNAHTTSTPTDEYDAALPDDLGPVDSTTRVCCNGIGTHTPDCGELADTGTRIHPPAWALPGAQPEWHTLTDAAGAISATWERGIGGEVSIVAHDRIAGSRVLRSPSRIWYSEPVREGITAEQAEALASELIQAAKIIREAEGAL